LAIEIGESAKAFISLGAGVLFFIVGTAIFLRRKAKLANCTARVSARVVEMLKEERKELEKDSDGDEHYVTRIVYTPVLEYQVNGVSYREGSSVFGHPGSLRVGQDIEIFYNPSNPSEARYPSKTSDYLMFVVFFAVGVLLLAIGVSGIMSAG
jgi:hypothetical protein